MELISCDLFDRHDYRVGQSKMVYYHTYLQPLALFVEQTQKLRLNKDMSRDVTPLPIKSSDELARSTTWRFRLEDHGLSKSDLKDRQFSILRKCRSKFDCLTTKHSSLKTQQTTIKLKQSSLQNGRHPIHRVRIPYSKFSSPKTCRNVHESSLKIGHTRTYENAPMTPEGH